MNTTFYHETTVQGIPCTVQIYATAGAPMVITGMGFGDAEPPEPPEFLVDAVYDRRGYRARWLERKVTEDDVTRIKRECDTAAE